MVKSHLLAERVVMIAAFHWPLSWLAASFALIVSGVWLFVTGSPDYPLDDAYIVQHAVESLHNGGDVRFGGGPLVGVTSPVHVMLVWVVSFFVPAKWAQFFVAAVGYCLFAVGLAVFAERRCVRPLDKWVIVICGLSLGPVFYHAFNGLETGLVMAFLVWVMVYFFSPVPIRASRNALLGVAPLLRPELAILSIFLFFRQAFAVRLLRSSGWVNRSGLMLFYISLGFSLPVMFVYFFGGEVFPNTAVAKRYFFAEGCMPLSVRFDLFFGALLGWVGELGLLSVGFIFLLFSPFGRWLLIFLIVFLGLYLFNFPGALAHNSWRYLCGLLPLIVLGWVLFFGLVQSRGVAVLIRVLLILAVAQSWLAFPAWFSTLSDGVKFSRTELRDVSVWVASNTPAGSRVLVHDAGYISLVGKQILIDLVGLKTPEVVQINGARIWAGCSRDNSSLSEVAKLFDAQYFVVLNQWDQIFRLTTGLRASGWVLRRVDEVRGRRAYVVYALGMPRGAER